MLLTGAYVAFVLGLVLFLLIAFGWFPFLFVLAGTAVAAVAAAKLAPGDEFERRYR